MSIIIKGMKMPASCTDCPLFENKYRFHGCHAKEESFNDKSMWNFKGSRPSWCPLIELPPHGDLIERNAAYDSLLYGMVMTGYQSQALDCINEFSVPTIIEAEEGE